MKSKPLFSLLATILVATAFVSTSLHAQSTAQGFQRSQQAQNNGGESISREEAAHRAQQATGGRVLSVHRSDNGKVWQVKVLLDNERIRIVRIDAQSGQVRSGGRKE